MKKRGCISRDTRKFIYNKCYKSCAYCGDRIDFDNFHVDHVVPVWSINSSYEYVGIIYEPYIELNNLLPACASCNKRKAGMGIDSWRLKLYDINERFEGVFYFEILGLLGIQIDVFSLIIKRVRSYDEINKIIEANKQTQ